MPSATELVESTQTSPPGHPVTFTATVHGDGETAPAGAVQFAVDGVDRGDPIELGSGGAQLVVDDLPVGAHTVAASYSGDDAYRPSVASVTHRVKAPPRPPPPQPSPLCRLLRPVLNLTGLLTCH